MARELEAIARENGAERLLVMCFEAQPEQCHRGMFAGVYLDGTGGVIEEIVQKAGRTVLPTPLPGPDRKRSAAMSSISDDDHESYARLVQIEDQRFDELIAGIRRRQDAGELTPREAADERIRIMTAHLQAIQELRRRFLGED
jgi:hypothetical protein